MGVENDPPDKGDENGQPDKGDATAAEVEKWKGLARKHEARAKAAQAEIDKAKADAANANKSDMDKLTAELGQLRADLAEERRKTMIAEIAAAKGLSPAQAKRLSGTTREELEADADDIVEAFGIKPDKGEENGEPGKGDEEKPGKGDDGKSGKGSGIGKPREKLRPGAASENADSEIDRKQADELAKEIEAGGFM